MRHLQHQSQHKTYTNLNMLTTSPTILDHQCSNICHQHPRTHYKSLHKHSPSPHQLLVLSHRTPLWTSPSMQQHIHCVALPTGNISTPTLLHTSITTPYERISIFACTPTSLIQHQTKGFAPYLHDKQAHHGVPCSHLLHISFLQRGIPWPCRLHSNQHNIRRLHSSPISTNLLHVCWPWAYNAEYPHLGSPVPITKNFLFSFLFFSFDAPLSSWAVCKMPSSHHTLCCHGTHNNAH